MSNEGYNGWENWETWNTYNWLSSSQGAYEAATECARFGYEHLRCFIADFVRELNGAHNEDIAIRLVDIDELRTALLEE